MDLHIIIDFGEISDKRNFVQEYFDAKKNEWNNAHTELKLCGFNVELYVEDVDNDSIRGGIYSLEQNKWIKKPSFDDLEKISITKEDKIKHLASILLTRIEDLEMRFDEPQDGHSLEVLQNDIDKLLFKSISLI